MASAPGSRLRELGWDDSWAELVAPAKIAGVPGRVTRVDRGICTVITEDGPVRASWSAALLDAVASDATAAPCTGDWCITRAWPDGPVTVERVLERRTAVVRATASRTSQGQVLVSNVDLLGVVVALHPEPNLARIERLMIIAWESGARPVVLLTKADLVDDADDLAEEVAVACPGAEVVVCSTVTGQGIEELRTLISPRGTIGLVGASGHGKSSLTNSLVGAEVLTTKEIRDDGKGRHTSVRRELVPLPGGGAIVDTPGLRVVGLHSADDGVAATFPDIEALADGCRFRDCTHTHEPGCAVLAALDDGSLAPRRLDSWFHLQRELDWMAARTDARLRAERAKKWKKMAEAYRARQHP